MKQLITPFTLTSILIAGAGCVDLGVDDSRSPLAGDDDNVRVYSVNITTEPHEITIGGVEFGVLQPESKDDNEHLVPKGPAEILVDGDLLAETTFTTEDEGRGWGVIISDWDGVLAAEVHAVEDEGKDPTDDDEQQDPEK